MHYRLALLLKASHFACVLCLAQHGLGVGGTPRSTVQVLMEAGESEMDCQPS